VAVRGDAVERLSSALLPGRHEIPHPRNLHALLDMLIGVALGEPGDARIVRLRDDVAEIVFHGCNCPGRKAGRRNAPRRIERVSCRVHAQ
jgi:hypothetical protein